ncbi:PHD finger protein 13-like [Notothenia coriiceps]|uniref:PHD finger protein 13-like n=1 Tax=Notothenia coriiceps TaxID=8208 RepID=A0A6I9PDQ8_9TELE|nr:PREDICTED: PHD finger protein 13-like [Notothenia coriiceps]
MVLAQGHVGSSQEANWPLSSYQSTEQICSSQVLSVVVCLNSLTSSSSFVSIQDSPLRSSSSPPNSTGSTADSDGWTPGPPTSCPQRPPKAPQDRSRKRPQPGATLSGHTKKDHTIPTLHPDDRRKAEKLKKKKRRKEREHGSGEESRVQQAHPTFPGLQYPDSFGGRTIKEEPEDDFSIPLTPQRLPSSAPCKEEPNDERQDWGHEDLEEGMVKVQKVEGLAGKRKVFRQGKQVVFRDEDGSGEDEDIMVDSGRFYFGFYIAKYSHHNLCSFISR